MTITINGSTGVAGINGSAGTPSVQGTDTNTGLFYPASDTVAVSTNGTERLRIDSSGNLLVGTTSATGKITSKTTTTDNTTYPIYMQNSDGSVVGFFRSDGNLNTGTLSNAPYNNTTTAAPNMYVSSSGDILRSTTPASSGKVAAWVNFNGSTAAINGNGNVSSVTKNSTGDYTVNFTVAISDANYGTSGQTESVFGGVCMISRSTGSTNIRTYNSSAGLTDYSTVAFTAFR